MNIFRILVIVAAILIIFSGIFSFRGAGSIGWTILSLAIVDKVKTKILVLSGDIFIPELNF